MYSVFIPCICCSYCVRFYQFLLLLNIKIIFEYQCYFSIRHCRCVSKQVRLVYFACFQQVTSFPFNSSMTAVRRRNSIVFIYFCFCFCFSLFFVFLDKRKDFFNFRISLLRVRMYLWKIQLFSSLFRFSFLFAFVYVFVGIRNILVALCYCCCILSRILQVCVCIFRIFWKKKFLS